MNLFNVEITLRFAYAIAKGLCLGVIASIAGSILIVEAAKCIASALS